MDNELIARVTECEARYRRLRVFMWGVTFGFLLILAFVLTGWALLQRRLAHPSDTLRVKEVVVVDDHGVERARLGGNLPDPVINGKTMPRGQQAAGLLLYDDTGRERGGYITFSPNGVVALTLDTRSRQVALFAADPDDGATAKLWRGNDWVEMRSGEDGTRVNVGHASGLVLQEPPMSGAETTAFCSDLKGELSGMKEQLPAPQILAACKQRMSDAACRKCIGPSPTP